MLPGAVRHGAAAHIPLSGTGLCLLCFEVVQVYLILPPVISHLVAVHLRLVLLHGSGGIALPHPLLLWGKFLPSSANLSGDVYKGQLADLRIST